MKIFDLLRKLGIFRSGASKGIYHNAADRPMPLQDNSVFDEKKDLTTKKDLTKIFKNKVKK
jgi:hypothetical protein